jgi:hypothetical protein
VTAGTTGAHGLLREAVRENASWCALVCDRHGTASTDDGRVWWSDGPPPPFHPDAMTLVPGTTADEVLARVGGRHPAGVKDSYAEIDLAATGFEVLFEASWIGLDGPAGASRATVRPSQGAPAVPDVVVLDVLVGGAVVGRGTGHRNGGVVGLSNVEVDDADDAGLLGEVFAALVAGLRDRFGALPVVGYEHGTALDAAAAQGFTTLGPLRVWARPEPPTSA